jgi:hypothetical protein
MRKKENSIVINTDDFKLELQTGFDKSFDWRSHSLGLFLEIMIEQSRDFFEKLHPDEKEMGVEVIGDGWKEREEVLRTLNHTKALDTLFAQVKDEISRLK